MSISTRRRYAAPAAGVVAVLAVIAATLVSHADGDAASPTGAGQSPSHAPSYVGLRDFEPTTSGGKVMVGP